MTDGRRHGSAASMHSNMVREGGSVPPGVMGMGAPSKAHMQWGASSAVHCQIAMGAPANVRPPLGHGAPW